jgi:hypothetical protein
MKMNDIVDRSRRGSRSAPLLHALVWSRPWLRMK